jgi:hypothetical protein
LFQDCHTKQNTSVVAILSERDFAATFERFERLSDGWQDYTSLKIELIKFFPHYLFCIITSLRKLGAEKAQARNGIRRRCWNRTVILHGDIILSLYLYLHASHITHHEQRID